MVELRIKPLADIGPDGQYSFKDACQTFKTMFREVDIQPTINGAWLYIASEDDFEYTKRRVEELCDVIGWSVR